MTDASNASTQRHGSEVDEQSNRRAVISADNERNPPSRIGADERRARRRNPKAPDSESRATALRDADNRPVSAYFAQAAIRQSPWTFPITVSVHHAYATQPRHEWPA